MSVSLDPDVFVTGERHLLSQLMVNLIENAMRHTPAGTSISIGLRATENQATLIFEDNGPGIPDADRSRVTERFVRVECSRSTEGHGLGLSLVKAISTAHEATLTLQDGNPGLRICVTFAMRSIAGRDVGKPPATGNLSPQLHPLEDNA